MTPTPSASSTSTSDKNKTPPFQPKVGTQDPFGTDDTRAREVFWQTYVGETKTHDDELIKGWSQDLDVLLIFAGLFSAVDTAFIIESYQSLQPDPFYQNNAILSQILFHLNNSFPPEPLQDTSFSPPPCAITVNVLFFASLCCSLFAAFGAVLGKQWLYHYVRQGPALSSDMDRGRIRQRKYTGIERWHLRPVMEFLPTLLQVSLILFQTALIQFLWPVNNIVASVVFTITTLALTACAVVTILSAIYTDSPYQSPLTVSIRNLAAYLQKRLKGLVWPHSRDFALWRQSMIVTTPEQETRQDKGLDWHAANWILNNSVDPSVLASAARFVPTCKVDAKEDGILNRLLRAHRHYRDDLPGQYAIERALIHVALAPGDISLRTRKNLMFIPYHIPEDHSEEKILTRGCLRYQFQGNEGHLLEVAYKYLYIYPSLPTWFFDVLVDRLTTVNPIHYPYLSLLLVKAFSADLLPPHDHLIKLYIPLAYRFFDPDSKSFQHFNVLAETPSSAEHPFHDEFELSGCFAHCFNLIRERSGSSFFISLDSERVATSVLKAFHLFSCHINWDIRGGMPRKLLLSLSSLLFCSSISNDFAFTVSHALYQCALQGPWDIWDFFASLEVAGHHVPNGPHLVQLLLRHAELGDVSLMGALLVVGPISQKSLPVSTLPDLQNMIWGLFDRLDLSDEPIRALALGLFANIWHILFLGENYSETYDKPQNHPIYSHLQEALAEVGGITASIQVPERLWCKLPKHSWYKMILTGLCHSRHCTNLILAKLEGHSHLQNTVRMVLSPDLDPKLVDALMCLWIRCQNDPPRLQAFLNQNIMALLLEVLQTLQSYDDKDDILQTVLRLCVEVYTSAPKEVQESFYDAHRELMRSIEKKERISLLDDAEYICTSRRNDPGGTWQRVNDVDPPASGGEIQWGRFGVGDLSSSSIDKKFVSLREPAPPSQAHTGPSVRNGQGDNSRIAGRRLDAYLRLSNLWKSRISFLQKAGFTITDDSNGLTGSDV